MQNMMFEIKELKPIVVNLYGHNTTAEIIQNKADLKEVK